MKLPTLARPVGFPRSGRVSTVAEPPRSGTIRPSDSDSEDEVDCANPPSSRYCANNSLTGIRGVVGNAAAAGCFSESLYDECRPDHVSGMYVRLYPHQRGDSHWTVRVVRRGRNGTNAVCHIPARQGNLDRSRPITCDGVVGGTFYSPDNDAGTYSQDDW